MYRVHNIEFLILYQRTWNGTSITELKKVRVIDMFDAWLLEEFQTTFIGHLQFLAH